MPQKCAKIILRIVQPLAPHANFVNLWIIEVLGTRVYHGLPWFSQIQLPDLPSFTGETEWRRYFPRVLLDPGPELIIFSVMQSPWIKNMKRTLPAQLAGHFVQQPHRKAVERSSYVSQNFLKRRTMMDNGKKSQGICWLAIIDHYTYIYIYMYIDR